VDRRIATKTLAAVYLRQGDPRKALEIYHEILKREPSNAEIREAIEDLKRKMAQNSQAPTVEGSDELTRMERIRNLEQWRESIRMNRRQRNRGETD